jgi:hypothetical protein
MTRFFMTIPEAVQLVLHAAVLGRGAEVFVLDMGEPVRIVDLAADMIRLSGLEVGKDVEIRYTGVRPGERLHEERFFHTEDVEPTAHPKIERAKNNPLREDFGALLESLIAAARECCPDEELRHHLKALVPELAGVTDAGRPHARPDVLVSTQRSTPAWYHRARPRAVERRTGGDRRLVQRRSDFGAPKADERRAQGDRRCGLERRVATTALSLPRTGPRAGVATARSSAGGSLSADPIL